MIKSPEATRPSPPSLMASIRLFIASTRGWLDNFFHLVFLEAKKAGISLALMLAFGVGAGVLFVIGWMAVVGSLVAALVENDILGWVWSLLLAALLSFAGAGGLVYLVIRRSKDLLFHASRRQLGMKSANKTVPSDEQHTR